MQNLNIKTTQSVDSLVVYLRDVEFFHRSEKPPQTISTRYWIVVAVMSLFAIMGTFGLIAWAGLMFILSNHIGWW
jgi:hypothetical protein